MNKLQQDTIEKSKREQIIEQAYSIFYEHGFHASGMDLILEGTGISKRTLYKNFDSKEELIAATIQHYHHKVMNSISSKFSKMDLTPREKILKMFDLQIDLLKSGHYTGCFAINAKLEYVEKNVPIEKATESFFDDVENFFESLCREIKCTHPKKLARQIAVIFRGTIISGQHLKSASIFTSSKEIVEILLDHSLMTRKPL